MNPAPPPILPDPFTATNGHCAGAVGAAFRKVAACRAAIKVRQMKGQVIAGYG